jgi:hypothetical protein
MTAGWLHETVDELIRRDGSSEKAIRLIEAGVRNGGGIAGPEADPTQDELTDARALVEVLKGTEWPPTLQARALLAADLLETQIGWSVKAIPIRQEKAAAAEKHAQQVAAAEKKRAERAAAAEKERAERAAAAARAERACGLAALDIPKARIDALLALTEGPFDVVCHGVRKGLDESAVTAALQALGYRNPEAKRVLLRALHIDEPQVLAYLLDEDNAIELKIRFEEAGARVKIKRHVGR